MSLCKMCGAENKDGAQICCECGSNMNGTPQPVSASQAASRTPPAPANIPRSASNEIRNQAPVGYSPKSRAAGGLLNVFFGSIGLGRFYLGYTKIGVAQLLVTLFTLGIGSIWGFIDGICILCGSVKTDGNGNPLN